MAKEKIIKKTKGKKKEKLKAKLRKQRKEELEKCAVEIGSMQTDVKSFIKKFKEDINKKRKGYLSFAQKFRKKK